MSIQENLSFIPGIGDEVEFVLTIMTALFVLEKPLMPLKQTVVIFSVVNVSFLTIIPSELLQLQQ